MSKEVTNPILTIDMGIVKEARMIIRIEEIELPSEFKWRGKSFNYKGKRTGLKYVVIHDGKPIHEQKAQTLQGAFDLSQNWFAQNAGKVPAPVKPKVVPMFPDLASAAEG